MKKQTIIKQIKAMQKDVQEVENLNRGGCGVFALACLRKLAEKGLKVNVWFGSFNRSHSKRDVERIRKDVDNLHDLYWENNIDCSHVLLEVEPPRGDSFLFDSLRIVQVKKSQQASLMSVHLKENTGYGSQLHLGETPIPQEVFEKVVENPYGWNDCFNREEWKEYVEDCAQECFC